MPSLVVPEVLGEVVTLVDVKRGKQGLTASVAAPDVPGLYRLVTTVHDAEGVALQTGAEGWTPALLVQVTRPISAVVTATDHVDVTAGSTVDLPVAVMNSGNTSWVSHERKTDTDERKARPSSDPKARLIGHWVRLDTSTSASGDAPVWASVGPDPGTTEIASLRFTAPLRPGEYLLVLDVMSRLDGSLTAVGGEPVVVRVTVTPRGTLGGS